ncbi:MAG: aminopeptidase P family N-terminal domain-containing protein, partial [Dehalococcoidia bacterium]|nr:aminopeptidase P family N-terminal domain-containing protein [Dehalococcoidia bacterium]
MNTLKRLAGLRAQIKQQGLAAILVSSAENRRYLSGFTGSAG